MPDTAGPTPLRPAARRGSLRERLRGDGGSTTVEMAVLFAGAVDPVDDDRAGGRCQLHKIRNVADDVPGEAALTVRSRMRRAYHADSALAAEAELGALAAEFDRTHPAPRPASARARGGTMAVLLRRRDDRSRQAVPPRQRPHAPAIPARHAEPRASAAPSPPIRRPAPPGSPLCAAPVRGDPASPAPTGRSVEHPLTRLPLRRSAPRLAETRARPDPGRPLRR